MLLILVAGACTSVAEPTDRPLPDEASITIPQPTTTTLPTTTTTAPTTTTTTAPPRVCLPTPTVPGRFTLSGDVTLASVELSRAVFSDCADHVVVVTTDPGALATGAAKAAQLGAPLLVSTTADLSLLDEEIRRLRPLEVTTVGVVDLARPPETKLIELPLDPEATIPATSGTAIWMVDSRTPEFHAIAVGPASAIGARIVLANPRDVRNLDQETGQLLRESPTITMVGRFIKASEWQLEVVRAGAQLPGGGQVMFPGRRLIAVYGSPYSRNLGVLGEQDPEESVRLAQELAAGFETDDDVVVVPAFDLITTVASADAGGDDDYSLELSVDDLRPWVDAAAEAGVYVVLDLQPGRTDFLTQAKRYEELLRLPHVGLALDPEWRLQPDQVHLRQIGSVSAAEINTVSEWLAGIVREDLLPQKLLVIHQFKFSMITERETIQTPAELAVVIQMDGQGPLPTKYDTYDALTAGAQDAGWYWGWKNFYDEDSPMATPEQTLAVEPQPVFVSYQ